jgi:hypothetical protein
LVIFGSISDFGVVRKKIKTVSLSGFASNDSDLFLVSQQHPFYRISTVVIRDIVD